MSAGWTDGATSLTRQSRSRLEVLTDLVALNVGLVLAVGLLDPALGPVASAGLSWGYALTLVTSYAAWRLVAGMTETLEPQTVRAAVSPQPFDLPSATIAVIGLSAAIGLIVSSLSSEFGRWALPQLATVVFVIMVVSRLAFASIFQGREASRRLLVLGGGPDSIEMGAQIAEENDEWGTALRFLTHDLERPLRLAGRLAEVDEWSPTSGHYSDVSRVIRENRVDTVVVSEHEDLDASAVHTALACLAEGAELITLPKLYERVTSRVSATELKGNWRLATSLHTRSASRRRLVTKRAFDLFAASLGLILLAPLLPLVAAAIYLDSPGPIFYKQERVGRLGKRFFVYKLRTMVVDSEPNGPVWAVVDDPRVTRVGRVLRSAHVDEFPQLVNILRGDMSAVGPRPERPSFVEELSELIPMYDLRHCVRPGMAGWGLIKQGYGSSTDDALLKLQYDLYYIENQSTILDVGILLRTVTDGLTLQGR